ncbi:hypothetical protein M0802_013562 [Mischocyttarus mexicanus]|nr:hypothetical protein M0802_013562 [Mischocyttarus mexicanus]
MKKSVSESKDGRKEVRKDGRDTKKVKLDKSHNGKPSKVVHIRNIPNEVSEAEIIHLGLPFGRVTNVLVLKGKNQEEDKPVGVGQTRRVGG